MKKALTISIGVLLITSLVSAENIFDIAKSGTPAQVRSALESGAKVEDRDEDGESPLIYAAVSNQDPEVISILLKAGAAVDEQDSDGNTPLMGASRNNRNPEVVSALLKEGAAVEGKNKSGKTALMYAAEHNLNPSVLSVLLEAGAKIDDKDANSVTALIYAAENSPNPEIISTLLRAGANIEARDRFGCPVLMRAASSNESPEVVAALLQAGARVDDRDSSYNTALIYAAAHNPSVSVISALLKAGADIEARNSDGMTPLMIAGQYCQNPEVVAFLARAGALVGDRDRNGETPLMFAAANNRNPEIINALLKAGANIDEPDTFGRTSLMVAASFTRFPEVIETLLSAGADTRRKDNQGRTALDCAKENKSLEGTKALWDLNYARPWATGLLIVQFRFYDIFPVFYSYYDTHALGQVTIMNTLDKPATDVRMSFFAREFMNAPRECPVPATLLPGESATADLFAVFQPGILQVTENTKVEAEVTLEYTENGISQKKVVPHTFAVLKRNALDWSDTRRAAAFVSPSDPTVLRFAKNVSAATSGARDKTLDSNLSMAMAMHEALTLYGLSYSQDPIPVLTPNRNVADFIQFPRQTLDNKGGKCSDLSVLYASLLEAVGVETAFITTPAHIFLAVALTLSQEDTQKLFGHPSDLIVQDGKVWLPLEVTLREGGFVSAWESGAREWRENRAQNQAALYPTHEAWMSYEPVALPGTELPIDIPPQKDIVAQVQNEMTKFFERETAERVATLQEQIAKANNAPKPRNELGVLYARYGLLDRAEVQFEAAVTNQEYAPALVNLGNISFSQGDLNKALSYYERAAKTNPNSAAALLGLARSYDVAGDRLSAGKAYGGLVAVAPDLAKQFAYLDATNGSKTRASDAGGRGELVWEEE